MRGNCRKYHYFSLDKVYNGCHKWLTHIPKDIPPEVQKVHLIGNLISKVPTGIFNTLTQCIQLRLDSNQISVIENYAFRQMIYLNTLSMVDNDLSIIQQGSLSGLYNLEKLYLSVNLIKTIEEKAFDSLHSLREVWLMDNPLTTLSPDLFINTLHTRDPIKLSLSRHDVNTDDWDCSSLCWLKHEKRQISISNQWSGKAMNPVCADGSAWESLQCGDPGEISLWLRL